MVLVIDNYDSFTWNLVQYLGALGAEPAAWRNDEISLDQVAALAPRAIVISPGPGTPASAGITVPLVRRFGGEIPLLGVCLGHQAIGEAYGGRVVRARRLMHGKVSPVAHAGDPLFEGVSSPFLATRYHSLVIDRATLPEVLRPIAWTAEAGWEDELQAVRHVEHAVWGVQFHPESIASEGGMIMLRNFLGAT